MYNKIIILLIFVSLILLIDKYAEELQMERLDLIVNYGVMYWVVRPLWIVLDYLFKYTSNLNNYDPQKISDYNDLIVCYISSILNTSEYTNSKTLARCVQIKSIKNRHSGKQGRYRHNLNAKRQNNSSRSVITPDPIIDINDIKNKIKDFMKNEYIELYFENKLKYRINVKDMIKNDKELSKNHKYDICY